MPSVAAKDLDNNDDDDDDDNDENGGCGAGEVNGEVLFFWLGEAWVSLEWYWPTSCLGLLGGKLGDFSALRPLYMIDGHLLKALIFPLLNNDN